jgi:hypothetical protein
VHGSFRAGEEAAADAVLTLLRVGFAEPPQSPAALVSLTPRSLRP